MGGYKDTKSWSELLEEKNGKTNVEYILKMQNEDSLNETSKKLIEYFKSKSHYKLTKVTNDEGYLIKATEKLNFDK